jgi:hypothetical protein
MPATDPPAEKVTNVLELTASLKEWACFLAGAPDQFWTRSHTTALYHALGLLKALERMAKEENNDTLVSTERISKLCAQVPDDWYDEVDAAAVSSVARRRA